MAGPPGHTGSGAKVVEALALDAERTRSVSSARSTASPPPISDHPELCDPPKQWPICWAGRAMPYKLSRAEIYDRTRRDQLHEKRHHRLTGAGRASDCSCATVREFRRSQMLRAALKFGWRRDNGRAFGSHVLTVTSDRNPRRSAGSLRNDPRMTLLTIIGSRPAASGLRAPARPAIPASR